MLYLIVGASVIAICLFIYYRRSVEHGKQVKSKGKVVVVTGCDTGFGNMLARHLDTLGYHVIAGCLDPTCNTVATLSKETSHLDVIQLDVTKQDHVETMVQVLTQQLNINDIWALVNNAGVAVFAETEWCSMQAYEHVLDVNLVGTIRVTKAVLPLLRKCKGRIINMVSLSGRCGLPGMSAYTVSKFGIIGFSDCLRRELIKFGIKVITIEPNLYRTNITDQKHLAAESKKMWLSAPRDVLDAYGDIYFHSFVEKMKSDLKICSSRTHYVIGDMIHAVTSQYPKTRYVPKWKIYVLSNMLISLPNFMQDWLIDRKMRVSENPKFINSSKEAD